MRKVLGTCLLVAGLWRGAEFPTQAVASPLMCSLQAVVVTTPDWKATSGTLACFERATTNDAWRATGLAFPVVVGRNGLGWGAGLHHNNGLTGPRKREGDGKSPAGVFRLSRAFGYAPPDQMPWIRLPYQQCTPALLCVDDTNSAFYNSLVVTSAVAQADWHSAEEMRRNDDLYRLGIFVDHNIHPRTPGGGSCIFLHIWRGPGTFTSGCTAMPEERLDQLLRWLDAKTIPVLVQLPQKPYERLRKDWALPFVTGPNARPSAPRE